jgi:hypothetical protein
MLLPADNPASPLTGRRPYSFPPTDSPRPGHDLGADIEDIRPVIALAVRIKERPPSRAAGDVRPPSCRAASRTIWSLGAPPQRPPCRDAPAVGDGPSSSSDGGRRWWTSSTAP